MATDPEARTQLARLLRDEALLTAPSDAINKAVDDNFELLVDGLLAEAAASDDVMDRESGQSFVRLRLDTLSAVLKEPQASRLYEAVKNRIEAW